MRDSLAVTGKKDPLKRSDESIKVEISLHQDLDTRLRDMICSTRFRHHRFGKKLL